MKKISISIILLVAVIVPGFAARTANVLRDKVSYTAEPGAEKVEGELPFGASLRILKQQGDWYLFSAGPFKGWIPARAVILNPEQFSNIENAPQLCPDIIHQDGSYYLYFYSDQSIVKYDILNRKRISAHKSGYVNTIHGALSQDTLLVEGIYTNSSEIHQLRILHLGSGQYINLLSFDPDNTLFVEAAGSKDGKYVSLTLKKGNNTHIVVFQTDNGEYRGTALNTSQSFWHGHQLLLQDDNSFWSYDMDAQQSYSLSFSEERMLFRLKPGDLPGNGLESVYHQGALYYTHRSGIREYVLDSQKDSPSRLKSLTFDNSLELCHLEKNDVYRLQQISTGSSYSRFSGSRPAYRFVSFQDKNILYSRVVDKLSTYFLAPLSDPYSDNAYKYKSIDKIDASSPQGILAEITHDKDISAIKVEIPWLKTFYIILLKRSQS